jgi:hypothetical protein
MRWCLLKAARVEKLRLYRGILLRKYAVGRCRGVFHIISQLWWSWNFNRLSEKTPRKHRMKLLSFHNLYFFSFLMLISVDIGIVMK